MTPTGARIVAVMVVRDENDIIAENILHHLRVGIDAFVVIDHGSIDGTFETLEALRRDGIPLTCLRRDRDELPDKVDIWYDILFSEARRLKADRALSIDADEFWLPATGTFRTLPWTKPVITALRFNMLAPREVLSVPGSVLNTHVYRVCRPYSPEAYRLSVLNKDTDFSANYPILMTTLLPKVAFEMHSFRRLGMAGHDVELEGGPPGRPPSDGSATIFHYPLRTLAQYDRKVQAFDRFFEGLPNLDRGTSWQTRYMSERRASGQLEQEFLRHFLSSQELSELLDTGVVVHDARLAQLASQSSEQLADAAFLNRMIGLQDQALFDLGQACEAQRTALADLKNRLDAAEIRLAQQTTECDQLQARLREDEVEIQRLSALRNQIPVSTCAPELSKLLAKIAALPCPEILTPIENGWLRPEEQRILYGCALVLDGPFLEMGAWVGKSTSILARGIRDSGGGKQFVTSEICPKLENAYPLGDEMHYSFPECGNISIGHVPRSYFETHIRPVLMQEGGVIGCLRRNLATLGLLEYVQIHVGDFSTAPDLGYEFIFNDCAHVAVEIERNAQGLRTFIGNRTLIMAAHDHSEEGETTFRRLFEIHESVVVDGLFLCRISNR